MKIRDQQPVDHNEPAGDRGELEDLFARALRRARGIAERALKGPVLAGTMALTAPQLLGCDLSQMEALAAAGQESWVHDEGQRNTDMVSYVGAYWAQCTNPNSRFGVGDCDIYVKLRVRPVAGASLEHKEVGIVYRDLFSGLEQTARGWYFTTWDNGDEEWHVKVTLRSDRDYFPFHAFYRDGAYRTFYDDNNGENHVVNNGPDSQIIGINFWASSVQVTAEGVKGKLQVRIADLDYDKVLQLVGTTDDWDTVLELGIGQPGEVNRWYWVQDLYGAELWEIDLDLPADTDHFEYAVVYRHGVINDAKTYEYWANNAGYNYRVERSPVIE